MKKLIAALMLVVLVMTGCSQSKGNLGVTETPTTKTPAFDYTSSSLYVADGTIFINLNQLNTVGTLNVAVTLAQTEVTLEKTVPAYVVGNKAAVEDFFGNVKDLLTHYKAASTQENSGQFTLEGKTWEISKLKIGEINAELNKADGDFFYVITF